MDEDLSSSPESPLNSGFASTPRTAGTAGTERTETRLDGKEGLLGSPLAARILQCLDGDLAGLPEESLVKAASGKAGDGLTLATINVLLLAGRISRLVAGGTHAQG